ncbi:hypothetical protein CLAFUW4_04371 [Fulvia fulva]|uniref:Uncharacterized protein n=1 Tax=Passalora fulva TaxID=5499 RepID=A0A9Q8LGT6_PASFU|nr:uncharacterized protein CLAFUR5_04334 [Fulvia fulva]KAK4626043.1 hypothetical protein CLAFUR4_04357 [Fulvia fulva]KAK4627949.1 hypothetical protein CLAFUR0_04358 [Fulvia fulva]UJO17127.1 hypothetical protein CLAFUR5_04334 [Fulvia fulva]WPV14287.1 hypothetical protein CLAFUW4_04371 [Fulvia fulva]WPV29123.1 hypothetical protein CLAFUW7_04360 [Fulvia fulva]
MTDDTLLVDTSVPTRWQSGPRLMSTSLVWTGPSTLTETYDMRTTRDGCPVTALHSILLGPYPSDIQILPCLATTKFALDSAATATADPTTITTRLVEQTEPTVSPVVDQNQTKGSDQVPFQALWGLLAASGVLIINAILVILWLDWRRHKQNRADVEDLPADQTSTDYPEQFQAFPKEIGSEDSIDQLSREVVNEDRGLQGNSPGHLTLPNHTRSHPALRDRDVHMEHETMEAREIQPQSGSAELRQLRVEQEMTLAELLPPMFRRSSMESFRSDVSSLMHPPQLRRGTGHDFDPSSPSEAEWRDMEMCSMSPVSPLGEHEGLMSRIECTKK